VLTSRLARGVRQPRWAATIEGHMLSGIFPELGSARFPPATEREHGMKDLGITAKVLRRRRRRLHLEQTILRRELRGEGRNHLWQRAGHRLVPCSGRRP
jgi:hypothetical protein